MYKSFLPILLVMGSFVSACNSLGQPEALQQEGVEIAALLPMTGALAARGPSRKKAVELAISQINQAGGIDGLPLVLHHGDSATDPDKAAFKLREILAAHPKIEIVIGPSGSSESEGVLKVVQAEKRVMISPASTSTIFTHLADDDRFFRTAPSDAFQGYVLASKMLDFEFKTAAILYVDSSYGQSLKDVIKANFEKESGHQVVAEVAYPEGESGDFSAQIQKLFQTEVEAVAFVGYPAEAPKVFNAWLKSGLSPGVKWFLSDGLKAVEILQGVTDPLKLDQLIGAIPLTNLLNHGKRFQEDYAKAYGEFPVTYAPHSYDATVLAAFALQKTRQTKDLDLRQALKEVSRPPGVEIGSGLEELKKGLELIAQGEDINYQGASGQVDLDAQGDVLSDYEIWTLKNGFIVQAETVPLELIKTAGDSDNRF